MATLLSLSAHAQQGGDAVAVASAAGWSSTSTGGGLSLVGGDQDTPVDPQQGLYLEVVLNQLPTGQLARFVMRDGQTFASAATLRELGLRWPDSDQANGLIALDQIPGLRSQYDQAGQRMVLDATLDALSQEPRRFGFRQPEPLQIDPATRAPGLILNYDLYGQHSDHSQSYSAFTEMRLFGRAGLLSNTMSSRYIDLSGRGSDFDNVRLDTYWQMDFQDKMLTLTVGDSVTDAVSWSRATRIGGIKLSRNFSLQPYRVTTPLSTFSGESVLPSTVDLYINGLRQSSQQVLPGQFEIDSVPTLNGVGDAQVVITDINGQSRVVNFSVYGSPQLLQKGLSDWSLELGTVRRRYGQRSFSYAHDAMFSGSGRYGLSERATLEAHAEATDGLALMGLGGVWRLGQRAGIFSAAGSASRRDGATGYLSRVGYQWNSRIFNIGLTTTRRDRDYYDVASLEGARLPRKTDQAYVGTSGPFGYLSGSYVRQDYEGGIHYRYATLNWSRRLPHNAMLNVSASRNLDDHRRDSIYVYWSLPLDRYTTTSVTARHTRDSQNLTVGAQQVPSSDLGGWGWRAEATAGDNAGGQAQINQLGRYGRWSAGLNYWHGSNGGDSTTTSYASANGGLVLMQGHVYPMRQVYDGFALVSTSGVAGVPVKLENRLVGQTDRNGMFMLDRLSAWQRNQISIDPMQLPADMRIGATKVDAIPVTGSGTLAQFQLTRIVPVTLRAIDAQGRPLPAGSPVQRETGQGTDSTTDTVVGHDGQIYLENPAYGERLRIRTPDVTCLIALPDMSKTEGAVDFGELKCL